MEAAMNRLYKKTRNLPALAVLIVALLGAGFNASAQPPATPPAGTAPASTPLLTIEQLRDLVAPIALYPDQLLSQVLVASTYPLEVVEAQQWLQQHKNLTG